MKYKLYYENRDIEYKSFESIKELEDYICDLYNQGIIITHVKDMRDNLII